MYLSNKSLVHIHISDTESDHVVVFTELHGCSTPQLHLYLDIQQMMQSVENRFLFSLGGVEGLT